MPARSLFLLAALSCTIGLALAESILTVDSASPSLGSVSTRSTVGAPNGNTLSFDTRLDLAIPANGFAKPAVASSVISGYEAIHGEAYVNDGLYGNGTSWIGTGADSWVKIDLGQMVTVDSIRFGRDRTGAFDDRDPGPFQVFLATTDDVYASGNSQNDSQEYTSVFDSNTAGFSGIIEGAQTIKAVFAPTSARYLKLQFANDGAAIDEVEVSGPSAVTSVVTEADACPANPCGEFASCTDLPGANISGSGRTCSCTSGYTGDGYSGCNLASSLTIKITADTSTYNLFTALAKKWESVSNGLILLKVSTASSMGTEEDIVKKIRLGTLNGAMLSTWGLHQIAPDTLILNVPGMVRSHEEREEMLAKLGPTLEAQLSSKGFSTLVWGESGATHVFSTTSRSTIASLQQAKFACTTSEQAWKTLLTAWGLKPVVTTTTDVLSGLQVGSLDTLAWTPATVVTLKAYTKLRYMSDMVWSTQDQAFVISDSVWKQIPSSIKVSLLDVIRTAAPSLRKGVSEETAAITQLKAAGVTVVPFTETAAWYALQETNYNTNVPGKLISSTIFATAQQVLTDYRAAHPAK